MKKIITVLTVLSALNVTGIATANAASSCPSVQAITAVGIKDGFYNGEQSWVVGAMDNSYDTKVKWSFVIQVKANNKNEAMDKATKSLKTMQYKMGPMNLDNLKGCIYKTDIGYAATINVTQLKYLPSIM